MNHRAPTTLLSFDSAIAVANKPSGLLVHRGWDNDRDVLMTRVRNELGQHVFPVHRLDRGTSGVVVFARSSGVARDLGAQFADGRVSKTYVALVRGNPPEHGVVDHPIPQHEGGPRVPALTGFRRLETFGRYALVHLEPRTGRLHQIRRHMKHIACPLIGDVKYGKGEHNRLFRSVYNLHRLALHAESIAFEHPTTASRVVFVAPLPEDFAQALQSLRLRPASESP